MSTTAQLTQKANLLLQNSQDEELQEFLRSLDFHTVTDIIEELPRGKRKIFQRLPPEMQSEVVIILSKRSRKRVLQKLSDEAIAAFLQFGDDDDATDILQSLPESRQNSILSKMNEEKRRHIERLLTYSAETAGGLMDMNFILVKPGFSMSDVAEKIQRHIALHTHPPVILVARENGTIAGHLQYHDLIVASPDTDLHTLLKHIPLIPHRLTRKKILRLLSKTKSDVLGVVDENEDILGIVHVRDLLNAAQAEATVDIFQFAGVHREEDALDSVTSKVKHRSNWLIINLATAFLAAVVVGLFQGTIGKIAILAVYMPIVAGQGGNAATQALAVVVRGLATGDVTWRDARPIILREATAGTINGIITGCIAGGIAVILHGTPMLGFVLAAAMIINLFVAGFFGSLTPFVLKRLGIDPATASSIFVTTFTDVFGLLAFLGLGTMLLL